MYEGTRTGLPISPALEAATLNRTRPLRRLETPPIAVVLRGGSRFAALADLQIVAGQRTLVRAADPTRISLIITNNDVANNIRVGDSSVTAAQGVRLAAGSSMRITSVSDIWVVGEGAATVVISLSEELL